jgi:hypothetical protein
VCMNVGSMNVCMNKVGDLRPRTDCYMVSFDVKFLFTNVPTLETIDILLNLAFKDDLRKEKSNGVD